MLPTTRQGYFVPLMLFLVAYAWLILWLWDASPYGAYVNHGQWTEIGMTHDMTYGLSSNAWVHAFLYTAAWTLMTTAMMLPTTLPLLEAYRRLTFKRQDRNILLSLVIGGYLSAWLLFGIAAHGLDALLRESTRGNAWLVTNGWVLGVAVFTVAGLFQFSSLKYRCLDKCRAPLGFVTRHWTGRNQRREAVLLGFDHGIYCVGCCWALMLLMFVVGTGSMGWMLLIGAVMASEKNLPFGRSLAMPLGVLLLAGAGAMTIYNVWFAPTLYCS